MTTPLKYHVVSTIVAFGLSLQGKGVEGYQRRSYERNWENHEIKRIVTMESSDEVRCTAYTHAYSPDLFLAGRGGWREEKKAYLIVSAYQDIEKEELSFFFFFAANNGQHKQKQQQRQQLQQRPQQRPVCCLKGADLQVRSGGG